MKIEGSPNQGAQAAAGGYIRVYNIVQPVLPRLAGNEDLSARASTTSEVPPTFPELPGRGGQLPVCGYQNLLDIKISVVERCQSR